MPSTGIPSASLASMSGTLPGTLLSCVGMLGGKFGGPVTHVVGQQQFPARHGDHRIDGDLGDRALVGDGEHAHLGDLVAPELDAHRVLGGRREDIENAAAHRELAALADHVDTGVGQFDEPRDDGFEFGLGTDGQRHRLDIGQVGSPSAAAATASW